MDLAWVAGAAPAPGELASKARYRQADAACTLEVSSDGGTINLSFPEAQWAVTPGQSAVLYDGEVCLGGGVIESAQTLG
jgi:tRNA-specific 2-thiouridylase